MANTLQPRLPGIAFRLLTIWILTWSATPAGAQQDTQNNGIFSLPRSQDDIARWLEAREDIAAGRFAAAAQRLHDLLATGGNGIVPTTAPRRFLGLRAAVVATLRELPGDGLAAYQDLAEREVGYLLRRDPSSLSIAELQTIADRFPVSEAGLNAGLRLADLAIERGDGLAAEARIRALLDAMPAHDGRRAALEARTAVARFLVLGPEAIQHTDSLGAEVAPSLPLQGLEGWPSYGGGYGNARSQDRPTGSLDSSHAFEDIHSIGFRRNQFAMHAVGDLGGVFVTNGVQLFSLDPLRQRVRWESIRPIEPEEQRDVERSINQTMALAPAVSGDLVVVSLQVGDAVIGNSQNRRFRTIDVINRIPVRRLFAFDRSTGKLVWRHWDERGGSIARRFRSHNAAGPPVIQGDTVFVASHDHTGAIQYYLSAYDLHTGNTKWRRLICSSQLEVNMFGNAEQEFAGAPLAVEGGVVFGTTNLGVCFAADADDGQVRWISAYDVIELPAAKLHNSQVRDWFFQNNPPVVIDGVVAFTPVDSRRALAFDIESGRKVWSLPYSPRQDLQMRWLLGELDGEFVFSGVGILGVKPHSKSGLPDFRVIAAPARLGQDRGSVGAVGRGAIADGHVWTSLPSGLHVVDSQGNNDRRARRIRAPSLNRPANLTLIDGVVVAVDDQLTAIHSDPIGLLEAAEHFVEKDGSDPEARLRLASLIRMQAGSAVESADADRAEKNYREGLAAAKARGMGPGNRVFDELATGLFELGRERALSIFDRDPHRGILLLQQVRDSAPRAEKWIEAHLLLLDKYSEQGNRDAFLEGLQVLSRRHGNLVYTFERSQRMPVAAWSLWKTFKHTGNPEEAVLCLQELLERFGDVEIAGQPARQRAVAELAEQIAQFGRETYASIESRAAEMLQNAGGRQEELRELVRRFPHSLAAQSATAKLLDAAASSGDLRTTTRFYRDSLDHGPPSAQVLRRLLAAMEHHTNEPLKRSLAERILRDDRDTESTYAPDGGRPFRDVLMPSDPNAASVQQPQVQMPRAIVRTLSPPSFEHELRYIGRTLFAPGFTAQSDTPIYACLQDMWILAFESSVSLEDNDRQQLPLFRMRIERPDLLQLAIAGETLLVFDDERVVGVHYRTGRKQWTLQLDADHTIELIGFRDGVALFFDRLDSRGDGGDLLAVEPVTGSVLWQRKLGSLRSAVPPVLSSVLSEVWVVDGIELTAFDVLSGKPTASFELPESDQHHLGIASRLGVSRAEFLQRGLRADAGGVYLRLYPNAVPSVVAISRDGASRWQWSGSPNALLQLVEPLQRRDGQGELLIVEQGTRSNRSGRGRFVLLDNGLPTDSAGLGRNAEVINPPAFPGSPVPPSVLIRDFDRVERIVCENLDGAVPSFEHQLPDVQQLLPFPVLTPDFLAIPALNTAGTVEVRVLDPRTQRSLLDTDESLQIEGDNLRLFRHGSHLIAQTERGIHILGSPTK